MKSFNSEHMLYFKIKYCVKSSKLIFYYVNRFKYLFSNPLKIVNSQMHDMFSHQRKEFTSFDANLLSKLISRAFGISLQEMLNECDEKNEHLTEFAVKLMQLL